MRTNLLNRTNFRIMKIVHTLSVVLLSYAIESVDKIDIKCGGTKLWKYGAPTAPLLHSSLAFQLQEYQTSDMINMLSPPPRHTYM